MDINETQIGGTHVAGLSGRLDTSTAQSAETRLLALIGTAGARALVVDLSGVSYVSSAGLRSLLKAAKQAQAAGVGFALAAPQPPVREVLEISGFDKILSIHESREAAAAKFG